LPSLKEKTPIKEKKIKKKFQMLSIKLKLSKTICLPTLLTPEFFQLLTLQTKKDIRILSFGQIHES